LIRLEFEIFTNTACAMKLVVYIISMLLFFSSCQKEFGYGNISEAVAAPPPVTSRAAVFTFDGAPNACTNISKAGVYAAGIPLTSSNKIKIDVNVLVPGTYSITTSVINGFSFSGSGTLETMGFGTVMLYATGTPLVTGTFIFTPSNNGCPFPIHVNP
jgi:hypothetical protein